MECKRADASQCDTRYTQVKILEMCRWHHGTTGTKVPVYFLRERRRIEDPTTSLGLSQVKRGFGVATCYTHTCIIDSCSSSIPQLQSDWSLSCDHGLDYAS